LSYRISAKLLYKQTLLKAGFVFFPVTAQVAYKNFQCKAENESI